MKKQATQSRRRENVKNTQIPFPPLLSSFSPVNDLAEGFEYAPLAS